MYHSNREFSFEHVQNENRQKMVITILLLLGRSGVLGGLAQLDSAHAGSEVERVVGLVATGNAGADAANHESFAVLAQTVLQ